MSPIAVLDEKQIELNATNVENFLRTIPQFAQAIGSSTNNGNDGSSTVDLRQLGEQRTLVLVNGKRFVPYDYQGYVDLSMIPTSLIERAEVITQARLPCVRLGRRGRRRQPDHERQLRGPGGQWILREHQ